jgi:hypothetical protein
MDMGKKNLNKNINWLSWFVGFFEGDGNFQIHYKYSKVQSTEIKKDSNLNIKEKKKPLNSKTRLGYSINISLSQIDLELLEDIKKILNDFGTIYIYPKRKEARLAIFKKDEIKWLIDNVFDMYPLITDHQKNRYAKLREGIINNITFFNNLQELEEFKNKKNLITKDLPNKQEPRDNWILGIINSEGCFYTRTKKNGNSLLVFQIEHTDKKVLEIIKTRFNFRPAIFERAERSINQKKTYSLYISSKLDITTIIEFCENPTLNGLLGNKKIQFKNWKEKRKTK